MLKIEQPFHGAVLHHRHGKQTNKGLTIQVAGTAPPRHHVKVNGIEAPCSCGRFTTELTLTGKYTDIVAVATGPAGDIEHRVRVVWDKFSTPRYRFSIDDNSFFLRDITKNQYKSLFDCHYLGMLRKLNRKYGTKFVLNCYYTTGDDFSVPQFPATYRGEWMDNAHWLKLSFHAYANLPDRPYQYASAEKLAHDYDLVAGEIVRFAGADTWSAPTVIHWGMVQQAALPVLRQRGVKVLSGFFKWGDRYDVNYWLDDLRCEHLSNHDALMDFKQDIVYSKVDIVCNNTPVPDVAPTLEPLTRDPNTAEVMDLFTHEQYFWPFYVHFVNDHAERLDAAIGFVTEKGYTPVFFHEDFLGGQDWPA